MQAWAQQIESVNVRAAIKENGKHFSREATFPQEI
jgi:hypothetical protein